MQKRLDIRSINFSSHIYAAGFDKAILSSGFLQAISIDRHRYIHRVSKFAGKNHFATSGRRCLPCKVEYRLSTVFVRGEILDNDVIYPGKVCNLNLRN